MDLFFQFYIHTWRNFCIFDFTLGFWWKGICEMGKRFENLPSFENLLVLEGKGSDGELERSNGREYLVPCLWIEQRVEDMGCGKCRRGETYWASEWFWTTAWRITSCCVATRDTERGRRWSLWTWVSSCSQIFWKKETQKLTYSAFIFRAGAGNRVPSLQRGISTTTGINTIAKTTSLL